MAVTVTYLEPATGAVAPTAAQVSDSVRASVIASADADTDAVITHNLGLSAADLALGRPEVTLEPGQAALGAAQLSLWGVTNKAANTVTVTKSVAVGSGNAGVQLVVVIKRPHSIGR